MTLTVELVSSLILTNCVHLNSLQFADCIIVCTKGKERSNLTFDFNFSSSHPLGSTVSIENIRIYTQYMYRK